MVVHLELPWPPSLNRLYRHVGPRVLISRVGRRFRETVSSIVSENKTPEFNGKVSLEVELYPPDNRQRDIDNAGGKALMDALQNAGVFKDDSQVKHLNIYMRDPMPPSGACFITIQDI